MSNQQLPILGDRVLVPTDPDSNNGAPVAAAIVTRVWGDDTVNVTVFLDGGPQFSQHRASAVFVDVLPGRFTDREDRQRNNVWTWPPRV